jgi:hypothetical protein
VSTSPNEQDFIQLNAYLDGELSGREREAFELRLAGDAGLQREFEVLRVTVSLVGMAERVPVPRNFTLDPAVYGRPTRQRGLLGGLWPVLSTAGAALSTLLVCVGLLLFAVDRGGGLMMAPPAAEEAVEEAAELAMPTVQAAEEPGDEEALQAMEAPTEEEAPMAMEAAPSVAEEAPAEEEMPPLPEMEEPGVPPANGVGGGAPEEQAAEAPQEAPAAEAGEPAADMAEGESAASLPTPTPTALASLAPAPTPGADDAGSRAADEEGNAIGAAEAPQQTQIAQAPVDTGQGIAAAAEVGPPARSKFSVAPLPVFLLAIGGVGLVVSLFGLVTSLRRRR